MITELFLDKYDLVSIIPNSITVMRELVVQSAIRGRLTHQSKDESASELIPNGRQAKVAAKGPKKGIWLSEHIESPFDIPQNWEWLCVGDAIDLINGRAFKPSEWSDSGKPIIRIQNLNNVDAPYNYYSGDFDEKHHITNGSLLISWSGTPGTSFGAFIWNREEGLLNQHIFKCETYSTIATRDYLQLAINARLDEMISHAQGGVGLRHITKGKLEAIGLPLPPLAEQKRIVAKVDELMALCDQLEAQQQERDKQHAALARASLARFANDPTPDNLQFLFHRSYDIDPKDLRCSIRSIAMQGRLVRQNPSDQPVEELLTQIHSERRGQNRTKLSEIRRIDERDIDLQYTIPDTWQWQFLEDLLVFGPTNGYSPKAVDFGTPVRSLTLSATTSGTFKGEFSKFIAEDIQADSDLWLRDGDILVQRGNTLEYVGVPAVYRGESNNYIYPDLMMKVRVSSFLDADFVHLAMSYEESRDFLRSRASGTSGSMPKINQSTLKSLPIPVPPLAEQKRIVAKVDELMALVDELETQLASSREAAKNLLEALVAELTAA